ncbi:MAG: glycine zipper 2TM domain-containing protein [Pseudomonadota bacterium]
MKHIMATGLALLLIFNIAYASDKGAIIGGIAGGVICNEASKGDPLATLFCTALGAAAGHELIDKPNSRRDQHRHEPSRHHHRPSPPPPPIYDDGWDRNRCDDSYSRGQCDQWQEEPYREDPYCYGRYCRKGCQNNYWHSGDRICFKQGRIIYFPPSDYPCRKMICNDMSDSCRCVERRRRW